MRGGARLATALLAAAIGVSGCSTAPDRRSKEERAADLSVAQQVEAALESDPQLYSHHIEVDARNGVVWLSGWVLSAEESREAVRTSAAVAGVRRVVDSMEVKDYFPH